MKKGALKWKEGTWRTEIQLFLTIISKIQRGRYILNYIKNTPLKLRRPLRKLGPLRSSRRSVTLATAEVGGGAGSASALGSGGGGSVAEPLRADGSPLLSARPDDSRKVVAWLGVRLSPIRLALCRDSSVVTASSSAASFPNFVDSRLSSEHTMKWRFACYRLVFLTDW